MKCIEGICFLYIHHCFALSCSSSPFVIHIGISVIVVHLTDIAVSVVVIAEHSEHGGPPDTQC